ncbi:MAG TPA: hypothetical protein ENJ23_01010, partial [Bacteroidetes bacterium]|nr:hypothetical protein [Bacteroidota bacterium]
PEFYERLRKRGISNNWMTMVGQGTLREYVVGRDDRPATEDEIQQMRRLVEEAARQGVFGVSSGLEYTPGSFASTGEIAQVCAALNHVPGAVKLYATHMRNEDDTVEEALQEAIQIARTARVGLQVSHLKALGKRNWPKAPRLLQMLDEAHAGGMAVAADRYPYSAYSTGLSALFPLWVREGGTERFLNRLKDPSLQERIREGVRFKIDRLGSWHAVLISGVNLEKNRWMLGLRVDEIARKLAKDPFEVVRELLIAEKGRVSMCGFGMSEENTRRILSHPLVAVASDGTALAVDGDLSKGHPHPRSFGTFPRVLGRYVREEKLMPLEEAVRKMTSLPARMLGLRDRGRLVPGAFADIVLFDPDKVADRATWENPKQYPVGVVYVLVNGEFVLFEGERTAKRPGRVLRSLT